MNIREEFFTNGEVDHDKLETHRSRLQVDRLIRQEDLPALAYYYVNGSEDLSNYVKSQILAKMREVDLYKMINFAKKIKKTTDIEESTHSGGTGGSFTTNKPWKKGQPKGAIMEEMYRKPKYKALVFSTNFGSFAFAFPSEDGEGIEMEEFKNTPYDANFYDNKDEAQKAKEKMVAMFKKTVEKPVEDEIEETTTVASVGGQYATPFAWAKKGTKDSMYEDELAEIGELGSTETIKLPVSDNDKNVKYMEEKSGMTHRNMFEILESAVETFGEDSEVVRALEEVLSQKLDLDNPDGFVDNDSILEVLDIVEFHCADGEELPIMEMEDETCECDDISINEAKLKSEINIETAHKENKKTAKETELNPKTVVDSSISDNDLDSKNQKAVNNPDKIGSMLSKVRQGMEDLKYDNITDEVKKEHEKQIDQSIESEAQTDEFGHKTPKMKDPNASKTEVGAEIVKKVKDFEKEGEEVLYKKEAVPVKIVKENKNNEIVERGKGYVITRKEKERIDEEVKKFKHFANFKPKK